MKIVMVMKIEEQVCSPQYAERLKELGIAQDSLFYWRGNELMWRPSLNKHSPCIELYGEDGSYYQVGSKDKLFSYGGIPSRAISAFTATELLSILPPWVYVCQSPYNNGLWACVTIARVRASGKLFEQATLADVCAEMLIHIIENNLLKVHIGKDGIDIFDYDRRAIIEKSLKADNHDKHKT